MKPLLLEPRDEVSQRPLRALRYGKNECMTQT